MEAFRLLGDVLRREGFPLNSIIRQWNYIERITAFDGPDQHYQAFNNARSDFYSKTEWANGYPAATGIGANLGGLTGVGLERQLRITMENIAELIADAKLVKLRVYLKNKSDYKEAERLMNTYGLNIPISYMWADVCRDELLIEIEGIAIR